MPSFSNGSIRLGRIAGIDIYLHWFWFLAAMYEIQRGGRRYSSTAWAIAEYLALFLIVLTHEFGHALACRQVGGDRQPHPAVAAGRRSYVDPPQRPGAMLWSIAAGPLVNVALFPLFGAWVLAGAMGWQDSQPDAYTLIYSILWIDVILFVFNMLPIYPLDGGKILRSLLWFPLGRAKSLLAAVILGMIGIVAFFGYSLLKVSEWDMLLSAYLLFSCWAGCSRRACC